MSIRDEKLLDLRPDLGLNLAELGEIEVFQNKTLRPILKLQHPIFVLMFQKYCLQRKIDFENLRPRDKKTFLEAAVKTDIPFRNKLLGIALGQMTEAEFEQYAAAESEMSRRCISMILERLSSVFL